MKEVFDYLFFDLFFGNSVTIRNFYRDGTGISTFPIFFFKKWVLQKVKKITKKGIHSPSPGMFSKSG